jgi:hypothetical protein
MAKILGIIPAQSYELIRDRITLILGVEIANQFLLTSDDDIDAPVYMERYIPIDKTEPSIVNVCLASGNFDNKHQGCVDGNYIYNIDVYTRAETTSTDDGGTLSTTRLHKLLGVCRSILETPVYKKLEYDNINFICSTGVKTINISDPQNNQDASGLMMGRLQFHVRVKETTELIEAAALAGQDTTVKLALTNKGYMYVGGDPAPTP